MRTMIAGKGDTSVLASIFVALVVFFLFFPLRFFSGTVAGHIVGAAGTVLVFLALLYPYRKRVLGRKGRKNPLDTHILFGLAGPTLVLLHAGHPGSSVIGALSFLSLLAVVLSGIAGFFLYKRISRSVKDQKSELAELNDLFRKRKKEISSAEVRAFLEGMAPDQAAEEAGLSPESTDEEAVEKLEQLQFVAGLIAEREYALRAFSTTQKLFARWRNVHVYLTVLLFATLAAHILSTVYYGLRWLP